MLVSRFSILLAVVLLASCGGGGGGGANTPSTGGDDPTPSGSQDNSPTIEGRVVDGPLSGARVFLDLNGNLIQDANEISVVTDANGFFEFPANTEANSQSDKLVAVGGTDISTGKSLPNMVLVSDIPTAEDASVVVTPVSTLIAAATTSADKQAVLTSLGITGSVEEVLTQDSWAQAQLGNQQAIAVQAANQAIAAVLQSATSLIDISGADSTSNATNLIMSISEQLVTESVAESYLFDETVLANVMEQGIEDYATDYEPSLDFDSQLFDSVASTLSTTIGIIQAADNPTSAAANEIVATVQDRLQNDIDLVVTSGNINNFISSTEPTSLFAGASTDALAIVMPYTVGDGIASNYCSTQIYHLNDDIHGSSGIYLTIENNGSDSLSVSIASADNSLVTQMRVESKTGASVETDSSAEPDTFTRVLSWSGTPPENETFDILWAKTSGGGMWIVRDISVPTEATCNGNGGGAAGGNTDSTADGSDDGSDGAVDDSADGGIDGVTDGEPSTPSLEEISVANGLLVGGADSNKPQFVVYVFDSDLSAPGSSNCNGGCAAAWPPVSVTDGMPSGVMGLGSIERNDGSMQVTYDGRPLYFYDGDQQPGDINGDSISGWHIVEHGTTGAIVNLFNESTPLEPVVSFVRDDGVVVTRIADRGRDRHAKDSGFQDHYDHYLAHYWEYRTMRIQLEDYVPNGQSKISATWITEAELGAREFRVWYAGDPAVTGKFFFNPPSAPQGTNDGVVYHGSGTWNDDFEKISDQGGQHKYTLDITSKWQLVGPFPPLAEGTNMEFEISMFLQNPPAGSRLNYYGTSFVYIIGQPGVEPFEWQPYQLDGTPIPQKGLSGGKTTLGYNYTNEPAGRFMQMATNMSPGNGQPFVRGRRLHHTSFVNGIHGERHDNPVWTEQAGKAGNHYINHSCASCHVRNGRALVEDVGVTLDKWVFKVADQNSDPMATIGSVLQPSQVTGSSEGSVSLGQWTEHSNGLRSPNYQFTGQTPPRFSARIAPQLVGIGLLEAVDESTIMAWADPDDIDGNGISGRASVVDDEINNVQRLGRFGYKANTFSVKHHISSALNTDMGVMTAMKPQPDCGSQQTSCGSSGAELAEEHVDDLVKYVSLLGVGARRDYDNQAGENLFAEIGCAGCHRPSMVTSQFHPLAELRGQTIYPYSDMLLHDMGEGLADNLGEGVASGAEWRTAPLWGLGLAKNVMLGDEKGNDSVSLARRLDDINRIGYLHDGRARTIDEAIRWHGGEAQSSKEAYEDLPTQSRDLLLEFLESL